MTGDHIEIPVDNDGIDKTELPEGRTELINLLYVVGTSIIHIGNQLMDIHQLHLSCCLAHRPHLLKTDPIQQTSQSRQWNQYILVPAPQYPHKGYRPLHHHRWHKPVEQTFLFSVPSKKHKY